METRTQYPRPRVDLRQLTLTTTLNFDPPSLPVSGFCDKFQAAIPSAALVR
jgi:hypothetical protein